MLNDWSVSRPAAGDTSQWMTTWREFTLLLEEAACDVKARLPTAADQRALLKEDTDGLSAEAQRLHSFMANDLDAGHGLLSTQLSPSFLIAQAPSLQTAFYNLFNSEHGPDSVSYTHLTLPTSDLV